MTFLQSKKPFFPIQNIIQHHVQVFFKENETRKKFQIFEENQGLTPVEKQTFSHYFKMTFVQFRKPFFPIQNVIKHHVQVFFKHFETQKNIQVFAENYGLTSLEKWTLSNYFKMTFLQSTKPSFRRNETQKKFQVLDENHGLTPLEKWRFSYYVKTRFLQSRKPFFLIQGIIKQHVKVFLKENKNEKKFQIFDENHELSASIVLTKVILHAQQNCTGYRGHVFSVRLQRIFCILCSF